MEITVPRSLQHVSKDDFNGGSCIFMEHFQRSSGQFKQKTDSLPFIIWWNSLNSLEWLQESRIFEFWWFYSSLAICTFLEQTTQLKTMTRTSIVIYLSSPRMTLSVKRILNYWHLKLVIVVVKVKRLYSIRNKHLKHQELILELFLTLRLRHWHLWRRVLNLLWKLWI